jgi:hypothetical protein
MLRNIGRYHAAIKSQVFRALFRPRANPVSLSAKPCFLFANPRLLPAKPRCASAADSAFSPLLFALIACGAALRLVSRPPPFFRLLDRRPELSSPY